MNLLIVDSCGERASLALFRGHEVFEATLPERTASSTLLGGVRSLLAEGDLGLRELHAIGVVSGPGSFTGLRVGLALVKGLCEAAGLPAAAVSRLAVLAEAAGVHRGFAALGAGRDQVYLRELGPGIGTSERLVSLTELGSAVEGREVALAAPEQRAWLEAAGATVRLVELSASLASAAVRRCLAAGGSDLSTLDANYVRDERSIYPVGAGAGYPVGAGAGYPADAGAGRVR